MRGLCLLVMLVSATLWVVKSLSCGCSRLITEAQYVRNFLRVCTNMLEFTRAEDPKVKLSAFVGKTCQNASAPMTYRVVPSARIVRSSIEVDAAKETYQISVWTVKGHMWRTNSDSQTVQLK